MTNPIPNYMERSHELAKLLEQSRQMIFAKHSFGGISEWIDRAVHIAEIFQAFSSAIEEGYTREEAWINADSDLAEFMQMVSYLEAPSFLDDVYGDTEVIGSLSDLSRHILLGYAEQLESHLVRAHKLLGRLVEDIECEYDLQGAFR